MCFTLYLSSLIKCAIAQENIKFRFDFRAWLPKNSCKIPLV